MVKIKNVYWMLAYAFRVLNEKGTQSIKTEEFENIYDLFATILIKGIHCQIKRGLNKEYIYNKESLGNLKGKIEITESIKFNTLKDRKMICEYDEFSVNSYMNQIIKATLIELLKTEKLKKKYKIQIKKIMSFFWEIDTIDYRIINWNKLKYDRNNITYKMLMNVCYLILKGLLLSEEKGENRFMTFIDDQRMCALYEKFVKEYYRKHFPTLKAVSSTIEWKIEENAMISLLPKMKTDITLTYKNKVLIIDTKYYAHTMQTNSLYSKRSLISANLYQIFAYVKNKDKSNTGDVQGMILYAKTDEEITPNQEYMMGKNKIAVKTLDLTVDFDTVAEMLDSIAYEFTDNEIKKIF